MRQMGKWNHLMSILYRLNSMHSVAAMPVKHSLWSEHRANTLATFVIIKEKCAAHDFATFAM